MHQPIKYDVPKATKNEVPYSHPCPSAKKLLRPNDVYFKKKVDRTFHFIMNAEY
jgi:hypothetical protein